MIYYWYGTITNTTDLFAEFFGVISFTLYGKIWLKLIKGQINSFALCVCASLFNVIWPMMGTAGIELVYEQQGELENIIKAIKLLPMGKLICIAITGLIIQHSG